MSELATNTAKYGSTNDAKCEVQVSFEVKNNNIHLVYRNDGVGFPASILQREIAAECIGLNMIFGLVEHNLGGKVRLQNDNGALIMITFPQSETE